MHVRSISSTARHAAAEPRKTSLNIYEISKHFVIAQKDRILGNFMPFDLPVEQSRPQHPTTSFTLTKAFPHAAPETLPGRQHRGFRHFQESSIHRYGFQYPGPRNAWILIRLHDDNLKAVYRWMFTGGCRREKETHTWQ